MVSEIDSEFPIRTGVSRVQVITTPPLTKENKQGGQRGGVDRVSRVPDGVECHGNNGNAHESAHQAHGDIWHLWLDVVPVKFHDE